MLKLIEPNNIKIYYHLTQAYEAEFSPLTGEVPGENGLFAVQTDIDERHIGYLLYEGLIPIGFMVFQQGPVKDVAEFYIIPVKRKQAYGKQLAQLVFRKHPGSWQVRQIEGAEGAKRFWRKVIGEITHNSYREEVVDDEVWGRVTRQTFVI